MNDKGTCEKHGEFILMEGCPECIQEARERRELEAEGETVLLETIKEAEAYHCPPDCRFCIPSGGSGDNPEIGGCAVGDKIPLAFSYDNNPLLPLCPQYQGLPAAVALRPGEDIEAPTAIVKIAPDKDAAYIKLLAETTKLLEYSNKLVIKGVDDKKAATNDLIIMGDLGKQIEAVKKEWLGPIDEHRKTVFDMFRQLTDPLAQAVRQTKAAMIEYDREQERIRLELEEIARKERELEEAKARAENRAPIEVQTVAIPEQGTGRTRSELGLASTVTTYKAKVVDFKLLSDDYKMPDMSKLNRVVNAAKGKIEIPGVEIETEYNLRTNRRGG